MCMCWLLLNLVCSKNVIRVILSPLLQVTAWGQTCWRSTHCCRSPRQSASTTGCPTPWGTGAGRWARSPPWPAPTTTSCRQVAGLWLHWLHICWRWFQSYYIDFRSADIDFRSIYIDFRSITLISDLLTLISDLLHWFQIYLDWFQIYLNWFIFFILQKALIVYIY